MSLMNPTHVCCRIFDLTQNELGFREGGLLTVLRDEQITHYYSNLYQGTLTLEGFAAAVLTIVLAPGQTEPGACAEIEALTQGT